MAYTRKSALLAALAAFACAACAVETGKVAVNVMCEDGGCSDQGGDLRASVEDCDEDSGEYGESVLPVAALGTGETHSFVFENVLAGTRCVQVFLDVDTNGELSAGDVISSEAFEQGVGEENDDEDDELDDDPELDVEVDEDETVSVDVVLDQTLGAVPE